MKASVRCSVHFSAFGCGAKMTALPVLSANIALHIGVTIGSVTPVTNPIVTPMCNAMFALKTGNAVIFAPHPKAEKCTEHLTDAFQKVVKSNGGPDNLV